MAPNARAETEHTAECHDSVLANQASRSSLWGRRALTAPASDDKTLSGKCNLITGEVRRTVGYYNALVGPCDCTFLIAGNASDALLAAPWNDLAAPLDAMHPSSSSTHCHFTRPHSAHIFRFSFFWPATGDERKRTSRKYTFP